MNSYRKCRTPYRVRCQMFEEGRRSINYLLNLLFRLFFLLCSQGVLCTDVLASVLHLLRPLQGSACTPRPAVPPSPAGYVFLLPLNTPANLMRGAICTAVAEAEPQTWRQPKLIWRCTLIDKPLNASPFYRETVRGCWRVGLQASGSKRGS